MQMNLRDLILRFGAFYVGVLAGTALLLLIAGLVLGLGWLLGWQSRQIGTAMLLALVVVPLSLLSFAYRRRDPV